jgi:hypothetical protein
LTGDGRNKLKIAEVRRHRIGMVICMTSMWPATEGETVPGAGGMACGIAAGSGSRKTTVPVAFGDVPPIQPSLRVPWCSEPLIMIICAMSVSSAGMG